MVEEHVQSALPEAEQQLKKPHLPEAATPIAEVMLRRHKPLNVPPDLHETTAPALKGLNHAIAERLHPVHPDLHVKADLMLIKKSMSTVSVTKGQKAGLLQLQGNAAQVAQRLTARLLTVNHAQAANM